MGGERGEREKWEMSGRNTHFCFCFWLVVPAKKKVWNWVSYLEEERMPAAPLKLFREVGSFFSSFIVFLRQPPKITNSMQVECETILKPAVTFISYLLQAGSENLMFVSSPEALWKQTSTLWVSSKTSAVKTTDWIPLTNKQWLFRSALGSSE